MSRWETTQIGRAGEPLADALAPAIDAWMAAHGDGVSPWDLALIAREVVMQVADERGLIRAWNARRSEATGKGDK